MAAAECTSRQRPVTSSSSLLSSSSSSSSSSSRTVNTQTNKFKIALVELVTGSGMDWTPEMDENVPSKWERHGDIILLPMNALHQNCWKTVRDKVGDDRFWHQVASALPSSRRLAIKHGAIEADLYRRPRVRLLTGNDGWVTHIDNGIKYVYDVTKCMFSAGNITEKLRIAKMKCDGETVVDLYAGIGYFTLPFLVHARAAHVHACEWNADSVAALERGLVANGVRDRCHVHFGDNRLVAPRGVAQRVNLGLIPSSEDGWRPACEALDPSTGGTMHVHGTVTRGLLGSGGSQQFARTEWADWAESVRAGIEAILQSVTSSSPSLSWTVTVESVIRVKSYAPRIDHLVVDLKCLPYRSINRSQ